MQSTADADILKQKLLQTVDEGNNVTDPNMAMNVITQLRKFVMTKEILEATRLGLLVNQVRKQNTSSHVELSRLCKALIKGWQSLLSAGGANASTNNNAAELGISPAMSNTTPTVSPMVRNGYSVPSDLIAPRVIVQSNDAVVDGPMPSTSSHQPPPSGLKMKISLGRASGSSHVSSPKIKSTSSAINIPPHMRNGNAGGHLSPSVKASSKPGVGSMPRASSTSNLQHRSNSNDLSGSSSRTPVKKQQLNHRTNGASLSTGMATGISEGKSDQGDRCPPSASILCGAKRKLSDGTPPVPHQKVSQSTTPSPPQPVVKRAKLQTPVVPPSPMTGGDANSQTSKDSSSSAVCPEQTPKLKSTAEIFAQMTSTGGGREGSGSSLLHPVPVCSSIMAPAISEQSPCPISTAPTGIVPLSKPAKRKLSTVSKVVFEIGPATESADEGDGEVQEPKLTGKRKGRKGSAGSILPDSQTELWTVAAPPSIPEGVHGTASCSNTESKSTVMTSEDRGGPMKKSKTLPVFDSQRRHPPKPPSPPKFKRRNWYAMLAPVPDDEPPDPDSDMDGRTLEDSGITAPSRGSSNKDRLSIVRALRRRVQCRLASPSADGSTKPEGAVHTLSNVVARTHVPALVSMPYVDIGLPDFIEHSLPAESRLIMLQSNFAPVLGEKLDDELTLAADVLDLVDSSDS